MLYIAEKWVYLLKYKNILQLFNKTVRQYSVMFAVCRSPQNLLIIRLVSVRRILSTSNLPSMSPKAYSKRFRHV